jgi:PAS domain S-box-containing protein
MFPLLKGKGRQRVESRTAQATYTSERAILTLDFQGKVVAANGTARRDLGTEESQLLGRGLEDLLERPSKARLKAMVRQALQGRVVRLTSRVAGQNSKSQRMRLAPQVRDATVSLELSWVPVIPSGIPPAKAEPDSEARRAAFETLFQAYLELQEVNKQKTSMVAAATHELKTPLAVISGACELLLGGGLGQLNPQQREIVTLSQQNCRRLLNVVNSFLDYAAVETGKLALRLEPHNIEDLVHDTVRYWKRLAQSRNVAFEASVERDLPPVVFDRTKLQNVLNSLCDNALKFTPNGGRVSLAAETHFWERRLAAVLVGTDRRSQSVPQPNSIRFSVRDSGPGISAEYQQEVFEEYFQAPGSPAGGMGLGLAIARRLVAAHKGKIWVESVPGQGATLSFVIPL